MSAREAILASLGGVATAEPAPPPVYAPAQSLDADLFARFAASLLAAGGQAHTCSHAGELADALRAHPVAASARRVWSSLPQLASRWDGPAPRAAHDLAGLDFALLRGELGVAESGAVWWTPRDEIERAAAFLAEHVALVVPREALVSDLHAAYARLDIAAQPYGCFVSGPSKTADIEQALVIGAHGPRSLLVLVVGASG